MVSAACLTVDIAGQTSKGVYYIVLSIRASIHADILSIFQQVSTVTAVA